jgi:hypothetical protein
MLDGARFGTIILKQEEEPQERKKACSTSLFSETLAQPLIGCTAVPLR